MEKEKLTESINKTLICKSTKVAIKEVMEREDRTEQQITRYCLNAFAERHREGKTKNTGLY